MQHYITLYIDWFNSSIGQPDMPTPKGLFGMLSKSACIGVYENV